LGRQFFALLAFSDSLDPGQKCAPLAFAAMLRPRVATNSHRFVGRPFSAATASKHDLTAAADVAAAATCRGGLRPLSRLAKTHSRSSTVLVDEFDAGSF